MTLSHALTSGRQRVDTHTRGGGGGGGELCFNQPRVYTEQQAVLICLFEHFNLYSPIVNFCILEVATQIVLETIFEMPSVLNWE